MQKTLVAIYRGFIAFLLMSISGSLALLLKWITLGKSTNFGKRYIVAPSSKLIMYLIGVRYQIPSVSEYPAKQVMYTFNHNSTLDLLVLTSLAIPDCRFFLSENTWKYIPITISALAIGVYYIPVKEKEKRRAAFFSRVTKALQESNGSVFVSSEGVHDFIRGIAPFNDGVYRMATICKLPVQPLYIHIPEKTYTLKDYSFSSGKIEAYLLDEVSTKGWKEEETHNNKEIVRTRFLQEFKRRNGKIAD